MAIDNFFSDLETKPKGLFYLSIFRVLISIILIFNVFSFLLYSNMLFSADSFYIEKAGWLIGIFQKLNFSIRSYYKILLILQLLFCTLMLFGIWKNITILIVFCLQYIIQILNPAILNGGDNFLIFILLYLSFADSFRFLSFTKTTGSLMKNFYTNIAIFCMKFHLCIIYLVSAFSKIHSDVWYNGVATYYTLQLERFEGTQINSVISKNGVIVTLTTYGTILIELLFPFFAWLPKYKYAFLIAGALLHLGIFVFMMIQDFQLIFILVYGLFLSESELKSLFSNKLSKIYTK